VFPIYLIFIATLLIITSRYSITIQRLTARRALPVLATLFLLFYTKVLLTVSNVLFFYTSITRLPSNHITVVWSVDTSVPLFGVKFTILFAACLILFLILVPFNVVLILTKKLSYFKLVTYFKPLLDAHQGPYKMTFYYWPGLQLLLRAIFFGLSATDRNINLTISVIMFEVLIWVQVKCFPFKTFENNALEFFSLVNLHTVFAMSLVLTSKSVIVDISVALAMFHLVCVILIHMKRALFKNSKCLTKISTFLTAVKSLLNIWHTEVHQQHSIQLVNAAPEVDFNYKEFQEPLIELQRVSRITYWSQQLMKSMHACSMHNNTVAIQCKLYFICLHFFSM